MWRRAFLIIYLQLLLICGQSNAFSGGADSAACLTLAPNHQGLPSQQTQIPATVNFENSVSLHRNQLLNLTIEAAPMRAFRGFTIQARRVDLQNVEESIVGIFELTEGMRHVNCPNFPQATATHTSSETKGLIRLTWRAPATFPGGSDRILVTFHFSIVESFEIFWTDSQSNPLLIENFEHAEHPQIPPGPFSPYTGCGTTKKCFGHPANCIATENCEMFVGVFVVNFRFVFELFATPIDSSPLSYISFALSDDNKMARSSVIECVNENSVIRAFTSFTVAQGSQRLPEDRQSIIRLQQGSLVDGGIHCLVERDQITIINEMTFDLNQNHFLLLAKGNKLSPSSIGPHGPHRVASDRAYSLVVQDDEDDEIEEFPSPYEGCGNTKTCFGYPNNCINSQNCEMFGGVFVDNGVFVFELFAVPTDANSILAYTSFALSDDNRMARSSVIECVNQNNNIRAYTSFAGTGTSPRLPPSEQTIIRLRRGQVNDGRIHCFVERNTLTTVGQMTFDLNERHFLLLAKGNSKFPTAIGPHGPHFAYSDRSYLLTGGEVVRAGGTRPLIMAHGSIMAIAWIGCATMGIFIAKYFKNTWSESSICGTAVWFFWHILFQILTWALTISAIIIIFVDVGEWRTTTHSILGIIVMSLAVVHPIGALFRPAPTSRARPIFNFMHGNFGFMIQFLAFFTIYFAVRLPAADLVDWTIYIIIAFVTFYAIMHIVFGMIEVFSQIKKNDRLAKNVVKDAEPYPLLKKTLLGFLALTVFLFTIAMVLLVTLPSPE